MADLNVWFPVPSPDQNLPNAKQPLQPWNSNTAQKMEIVWLMTCHEGERSRSGTWSLGFTQNIGMWTKLVCSCLFPWDLNKEYRVCLILKITPLHAKIHILLLKISMLKSCLGVSESSTCWIMLDLFLPFMVDRKWVNRMKHSHVFCFSCSDIMRDPGLPGISLDVPIRPIHQIEPQHDFHRLEIIGDVSPPTGTTS